MLHRTLLIAIAFLFTTATRAADVPATQPASLQRSLIVSGQGYFPVAIRLADSRIAVVLRGGATHVGIKGRLDMVFSADEGKTWTPPSLVVDSPVDDRNPALGQAKNGTIVVGFWRTAQYDDKGRFNTKLDKPTGTWVTRSIDGGKTWTPAAEIDVKDIGWGSPYGKILTLPDGVMLMAVYGGPIRTPGEKAPATDFSYLYRSTDDGKTWTRWAQVSSREFNETSLLRLPSGKLLAALRAAGGGLSIAQSSDDGKTWTDPAHTTPVNVHPADLLLLPDGRVLLVASHRITPFGVCGMISDKDGVFDFSHHFILTNDAISWDCGYPSSVALKDGRILTVYYATASKDHPTWGLHAGALIYAPP